jgi:cytochrome c5
MRGMNRNQHIDQNMYKGLAMKTGIMVLAAMSMIIISCGKSDDTGEKTGQVEKAAGDQPAVIMDSAVTTDVAVEPEESTTTAVTEPAAQQQAAAADGETVYRKSCASCHMTGAAGAPKTGDQAAWSPRIARGIDTLVESAIAGIPGTAMMPRGACTTCSDEEIEAAVHYMTDQMP